MEWRALPNAGIFWSQGHGIGPLLVVLRANQRRAICSECIHAFGGIQRPTSSKRTSRSSLPRCFSLAQVRKPPLIRRMATVSDGTLHILHIYLNGELMIDPVNPDSRGPLDEYDERVHSRRLREDEHQRSNPPSCLRGSKQTSS